MRQEFAVIGCKQLLLFAAAAASGSTATFGQAESAGQCAGHRGAAGLPHEIMSKQGRILPVSNTGADPFC